MKLNTKKTIFVGLAFFLISMFWQAYDTLIPMILTRKFGFSQTASGAIMAIDNVIAVILLPVFGALSDRTHTRFGRRTPYITIGTVLASLSFFALSFIDRVQMLRLGDVGDRTNEELIAEAWEVTVAHPGTLILFIGTLLFVLLSMALFRSPAVALMPDVTIKPLRSRANAIINLMGAAGGILVLGLGIVFGTGKTENARMAYLPFIGIVSALMLLTLLVFLLTVKEPKLVKEMHEERDRYGIKEDEEEKSPSAEKAPRRMTKQELISLFLILGSVALWYMGYNAVTTKYSLYAGDVLGLDYNTTLIIAQAAAILTYVPAGFLASKIGRRKSILIGITALFTAFLFAGFLREGAPMLLVNLLFCLAGIGWATINVNSFPMVVELSRDGDVGKYTGYYYTASMTAQIVTPIFSGVFLDSIGMEAMFPYAAIFVALSFLTMFFVRHGDNRPGAPKDILSQLNVDD